MTAFDEPEYTKSDEDLKEYAREYLRDCRPKEYRSLIRKGQLEDRLQEKADRTRAVAEKHIKRGVFPEQAWHWAIRVEILGAEMD